MFSRLDGVLESSFIAVEIKRHTLRGIFFLTVLESSFIGVEVKRNLLTGVYFLKLGNIGAFGFFWTSPRR